MGTAEQDRIRADMLLEREKAERRLKSYCCKAYQYGKKLSLLAVVMLNPQDKETWKRVRKEMDIPLQVHIGGDGVDKTEWLPDCPSQQDIKEVLRGIQEQEAELERLHALLK